MAKQLQHAVNEAYLVFRSFIDNTDRFEEEVNNGSYDRIMRAVIRQFLAEHGMPVQSDEAFEELMDSFHRQLHSQASA